MGNDIFGNMISKPEFFTGEDAKENDIKWLKQVNRIRVGLDLSDEKILFVAGNHLRGKAETWWCINEDKIKTWEEFRTEFSKVFGASRYQSDIWWNELENIKQTNEQTVDDIKLRVEELCNHLSIEEDNSFKIRHFKNALRKDLQYELDRFPPQQNTWKAITDEARRLEMIQKKHGIIDTEGIHNRNSVTSGTGSVLPFMDNSNYARSSSASITNSDISSTLKELCNSMEQLKISINNQGSVVGTSNGQVNRSNYNNHQTNGTRRYDPSNNMNSNINNMQCYLCGTTGHKAYNCPQSTFRTTGQNNNAQEQGKGDGQQ
jgi:hypothetical protein